MTSAGENKQSSLISKILQSAKQAFDTSTRADLQSQNLQNFNSLIEGIPTQALLPALNLLVQPGRIPERLRENLISTLAQVPLRANGVQDTIEFILSIHPSTNSINATSTGRTSFITHDALNAISRLLSSHPATISAEAWFNGIAPQLLYLLLGNEGQDLDKVVAYVIGFGILGRKQYGSPGSPGWRAIIEPIYKDISPSNAIVKARSQNFISPDGTEYVELRKVVSTPLNLKNSLKRITSLVTFHPHPFLAGRILSPILYSLWTLSCWPNGNELTENSYRKPAKKLLKMLLHLSSNNKDKTHKSLLNTILENIICERQNEILKRGWKFASVEDGGIQIEIISASNQIIDDIDLQSMNNAIDFFISLLRENTQMSSEVSVLFASLGSKWLAENSEESHILKTSSNQKSMEELDNERVHLIELNVLQKLITELPEKLIENSKQLLEFTYHILNCSNESNYSEANYDAIPIALSLLNVTITATSFRITTKNRPLIEMIEKALKTLDERDLGETSRTARNLLMLISLRDTVNSPEPDRSPKEILLMDQHLEDKKTYNLALSYITSPESPPPVRVQGLELLSSLLEVNSPIIDVPSFVTILTSILVDEEEYVHLRVIKLLVQLSHKHPKTTIRDIIDRYVDPNEECELDQRLRLGEALHQILQSNTSFFSDEIGKFLCEALLFVGSRRGTRPKTKERHEKATNKRKIEAEKAWGGPLPQLDQEIDFAYDEDFAINFQIVSGWESCRGTEDIRIRSSAITILGAALKANLQSIKSQLVSAALDLSIHILSLERDIEKSILRRAAVVLVMNFLQALDSAKADKQSLKFGLTDHGLADVRRIMKYAERTDNDNLVREHCKTVIESLESWSLANSLLPFQQQSASIQYIVGLPLLSNTTNTLKNSRPNIVEVE
ncbi:putative protein required for cell viability [Erysiphe necator]|uniref:Uncharacterized protein n=1 Tax=Uncinula necator TaxID=52586 RepID=A0A0B1PDH1_UNCNE|nr:putative protein required for cell viability [Erysiphe necator]